MNNKKKDRITTVSKPYTYEYYLQASSEKTRYNILNRAVTYAIQLRTELNIPAFEIKDKLMEVYTNFPDDFYNKVIVKSNELLESHYVYTNTSIYSTRILQWENLLRKSIEENKLNSSIKILKEICTIEGLYNINQKDGTTDLKDISFNIRILDDKINSETIEILEESINKK